MEEPESKKKATLDFFRKEQLINSTRYREARDLLGALLKEERSYTLQEVDSMIQRFLNGKIN